jgi:hypothetical protein
MNEDISNLPKLQTSTQIFSEFSGQNSFTTDELQRLHFTDDPLIAIWLKEVVISAITREILCKWRKPLISHIKHAMNSNMNIITVSFSISGSVTSEGVAALRLASQVSG